MQKWRLTLSSGSRSTFVSDPRLPKSQPSDQPSQIAIVFTACFQCITDLSCDQFKIPGIGRNRNISRPGDHPVGEPYQSVTPPRIPSPDRSDTRHHVVSLLPNFEKTRNELGWVLKVRVQHDHRVSRSKPVPGRDRHFHFKITTES